MNARRSVDRLRRPHGRRGRVRASTVAALGCALLPAFLLGAEATAELAEFHAFLLPAVNQIEVGQLATVRFEVDTTAMGFNGYEVVIEFDPTVVSFIPPVIEGALLTGACGNTFTALSLTDSTVRYTHVILCAGVTLDGPGVLSTYRFMGLADGVSPLTIVSSPDSTFIDAGEPINPQHPSFPRQVLFHHAEIRVGNTTAVSSEPAPATPALRLAPNVPNPFNPATTLYFVIDRAGPVRLLVHDVHGRRVWGEEWSRLEAGPHELVWRAVDAGGRPLPSGVYIASLATTTGHRTRALTLVR